MNKFSFSAIFRRRTASTNWMPEVDGLRFIAIFGVFLTHTYGYISRQWPDLDGLPVGITHLFMSTAGRGVELFFMVSGFILGLPFIKYYLHGAKRVSLRSYYWRRLTRLEPPYIIIMIGFFLLRAFPLHPQLASSHDFIILFKSLLASLVYGHWIYFEHTPFLNVVAWSLEIEVQFYLLVPFFCMLIFRLPEYSVRFFLVILILTAPWIQSSFSFTRYTLLGEYQFFLAGLLLAVIYLDRLPSYISGWGDAVFSVVVLVAFFLIPIRQSEPLNITIFTVCTFLLFIQALKNGWLKKVLSLSWVALIGGMCYSIYLLHYQLILIVGSFTRGLKIGNDFWVNFMVQFTLLSAIVLFASAMFYVFVEKPCMDPKWMSKLMLKLRR